MVGKTSTMCIMFAWRVLSGLAIIDWILLAIFIDKIWVSCRNEMYI